MIDLQARSFTKKLKHLLDPSKSGWYTIFLYDDDPVWMTVYHDDTKIEYYMKKEYFKQNYKKYE